MKKAISLILTFAMLFTAVVMTACTAERKDISGAKNLADLSGARIAAQAGTFHADALAQIKGAKTSTLPEFADLLIAVKSGSIDGYIAEEPTALAECLKDSSLGYIALKNNDTGFTATDADVGVAVGLKTGSALTEQINAILAEITADQRAQLMEQMVKLCAGEKIDALAITSEIPENPTGTLKVGMECAYQPFNWTVMDGEESIGAVPIYGEGKDGLYANGYDVQIAQYVANKLGMKLEVYSYAWDSLVPAVQSGNVDAIIAGMSPTAEREEEIDFTSVYYESNLVVIYKK